MRCMAFKGDEHFGGEYLNLHSKMVGRQDCVQQRITDRYPWTSDISYIILFYSL